MATLGLYRPAEFLERAPMMFYALEEDVGYKVPVVFVHGIDGSPRDFAPLLERLDRTRYKAWFFYYPTGQDLSHVAAMFHRVFLSGKVIPLGEMPLVIVAHSMGGVVVREAMNRCTGRAEEAHVAQLITIASPLGGHPAAHLARNAPLAVPSWRDLDPEGAFIANLYRRALPAGTGITSSTRREKRPRSPARRATTAWCPLRASWCLLRGERRRSRSASLPATPACCAIRR
jgi:pimeloyl-ACP methyl ester carboxylesterase